LRFYLQSLEIEFWRRVMPAKRKKQAADEPQEILMPMDGSEEEMASADDHNPRTNPAMRDGDSSHGNPSETAVDVPTTDNDVGDSEESEPPYSGISGGAVGGTPAEKRATGGSSHTGKKKRGQGS